MYLFSGVISTKFIIVDILLSGCPCFVYFVLVGLRFVLLVCLNTFQLLFHIYFLKEFDSIVRPW